MKTIADFIMALLNWIGDSSERLKTALIIILVLGLGNMVYSYKDHMTSNVPKMSNRYNDVAEFIFKHSKAETIAIMSVDQTINQRKVVSFHKRPSMVMASTNGFSFSIGSPDPFIGKTMPIISTDIATNKVMLALINNETICAEMPTSSNNIVMYRFQEYNVTYMCTTSVPPELGYFIGQITVGFKEPQDKAKIESILVSASGILRAK